MPIIGNSIYPENKPAIASVLEAVLGGASKVVGWNKDKAYRKAAAKIMGVPEEELGYFQRDELKDLVKDKMKSSYGEYKPKTKEEALEFEQAKAGYKGDSETKRYKENEARIGNKILNGEKVTKQEAEAWQAMDPKRYVKPEQIISDIPETVPTGNQSKNGGMAEMLKSILGGTAQASLSPLQGFMNLIRPQQGAPTSPVPSAIEQPGEVAPAPGPEAAPDPIAQRVQEALAAGMDPEKLASMLQEKGIDPATYGL